MGSKANQLLKLLCVKSYWFNMFQYEMELFENKAACQTPLECQYHLDVKALKKAKGRRNRRIFTYTDHDRYTNSLPFNQLVRSPLSLSASVSHVERISSVFKILCENESRFKNISLHLFPSFKQYSSILSNTTKSWPTSLAERMTGLRHRAQDHQKM